MVIGFDGSRAFVKNRTGTENYSYQLLKHLSLIDMRQSLYPSDIENHYLVYVRPGSEIQNSKFKIQSWTENFSFVEINYKRFWTQAGLSMQTFKDKLDVLFVPSHTLPIIRNPDLKTVITVHDLGAEYLPKMHQLKQQLYLKYMTYRQLKGATKIIAVSKATKDDLVKRVKIDPKKIEVIYEGVDREVFKPVKNDVLVNSLRQFGLLSKNGRVEKGKYFLFVGTIQPRKNLERLIISFSQFLKKVKSDNKQVGALSSKYYELSDKKETHNTKYIIPNTDIQLVLVGSKGWLSEEIYVLPKKLGIEDKVKFLGHVANEDLPALYSGAIALVFPSLFEGFGLPILEAMSCGTPVITSNISSMPEVAGDAAVLVDPTKVEEITEALEKVAANDKLRDNLMQKGYKQVEKFSWEKAARETLQLFKSLKS